ncbi:hypothetical protein ACP275_14G268300 [Erythranthe tilingii]
MAELGFQDSRSGFRARDLSPDSVIFTPESNFSLFSSASASVERCSFTSDVPDQDSVSSALSQQHLAVHDLSQALSGPDPDPNKPISVHKNSITLTRKGKAKVKKLDSSDADTTEDENIAVDSARHSFSQALKECQDRRFRSEVLLKKPNHQRPASLDLNSSSPRLKIMKKPSSATPRTANFPSPGTPNYRHSSVGVQKGWSSERIPLHSNANRRNLNTALLPYNTNGRTLPSKWEDAERWIFSPVTGDGALRASFQQQPQRRPKSKSGPLGPPGVAYYHLFSPAPPEGGGKQAADSPFSTGVMASGGNFLMGTEPCMARSISIHGCSEMISQSSLTGHHDEKYGGYEDAANNISRVVSRRDMATQMSPESSMQSSPGRISSFSLATPSVLPLQKIRSSSKKEIRDVKIDERVTVTRWSKKNNSQNANDWKRKDVDFHSASWEVVSAETSTSVSKIEREESKITAWENLQKAKAEAAIRKLEMKLEKKRSSSMDKIMNKLRYAQKKAQEMRSHQIGRPSEKALSFRRARQITSLSGCFTCHAF